MEYDDDIQEDILSEEDFRKSGVRRINNFPVYLIIGIAFLFFAVMVIVGFDRAATKKNQSKAAASGASGKKVVGDTIQMATGIVGAYGEGGVIKSADVKSAQPDRVALSTASLPIARPDNNGNLPPPIPPAAMGRSIGRAADANDKKIEARDDARNQRILSAKLQQFEEAIISKTSVQAQFMRGSASSGGKVSTGSKGGTSGLSGQKSLGDDRKPNYTTRNDLSEFRQKMAARRAESARDMDFVNNQHAAVVDMMNDPAGAYRAKSEQAKGLAGLDSPDDSSPPKLLQKTARDSEGNKADSTGDRWKLPSHQESPVTPYQLRAGFIVPATLISGINSDLPGQIMAQVSQDVYDTPSGKYKLIPLGSRLIGVYKSEIAYGQSRIFVAWQRIIFPDGKAMDIGSMPGADAAGFAGLRDLVNNHFIRLFASAILLSGVTASVALSQDDSSNKNNINDNSKPDVSSELSQALGQQLGQLTTKLIEKNLSIAPTIEIRPGFRFNVIVAKDMTFSKPYEAFDY